MRRHHPTKRIELRSNSLLLLLLCPLLLLAGSAEARVLSLEIERRVPVLDGHAFPTDDEDTKHSGIAYELIEGRVTFGFDPGNEANARVTDLSLAPVGESGLVEASADFAALQPIDPAQRRGTAFVDVPNRGRRLALSGMNRVQKDFGSPATLDEDNPLDWGDGFLMSQGLTVLWVGWQADAPPFPGAMGLDVPRAMAADGTPIQGHARSDWVVDEPSDRLALAVLGHATHLPIRTKDAPSGWGSASDSLTRRRGREAKREAVPRAAWQYDPSGEGIVATGQFEAGWIYELVYLAENPPLVGLGFAAFRDFAAYAESDPSSPFPVERTVAHGLSQSGRFLRHFLHDGFNRDEAGRQVFDGVMIQIGGAGRGGFNHRFSHPGRVGNPYANFFYPGDQFPFASRPTNDGEHVQGLLDLARLTSTHPKIFQINTGYEYWGRGASLIHMTPDGREDVLPLDHERLYHIASAPHYSLPFPPNPKAQIFPGLFLGSSVDTSAFQRALLLRLLDWVETNRTPPDSQIPRIDADTLVPPSSLQYPIAALTPPRSPHLADRLNFGPRWSQGIIDEQPPQRGRSYPIRVPAIDALGSEATGLRALELRVPIGTYTPWALRYGKPGGADEMTGYIGSFWPLARRDTDRHAGDQRPSLATLYPDRETYEKRVAEEIDALVKSGFMLSRDRAHAWRAAGSRWRWTNESPTP